MTAVKNKSPEMTVGCEDQCAATGMGGRASPNDLQKPRKRLPDRPSRSPKRSAPQARDKSRSARWRFWRARCRMRGPSTHRSRSENGVATTAATAARGGDPADLLAGELSVRWDQALRACRAPFEARGHRRVARHEFFQEWADPTTTGTRAHP